MDADNELLGRVTFALLVVALLAIVAYVATELISVVVFAIFLYYAVRPIFRKLGRFDLPRRLRAMLALVLFGIPFVLLIVYTLSILVLEIQAAFSDEAIADLLAELDVLGTDPEAFENLVDRVDERALAGELASVGVTVAAVLSSLLVRVLLVVIAVYYMLVDGPNLIAWLLNRYDESGTLERYVRTVDPELSLTLFGNIVNVFVTAIIAIAVFYAFNAVAPAPVQIPFPALLGALAGVGSLIPVVGIKLVYVPIVLWQSATAWFTGDLSLLVPIVGLLVVSAVIVDFVPDFFIRAHVSGDQTHTGLLMLAYIVGPTLFGFYGLFFAPIALVLTVNAVTILLPYAVSGETARPRQSSLDEFGGGEPEDRTDRG